MKKEINRNISEQLAKEEYKAFEVSEQKKNKKRSKDKANRLRAESKSKK